MASPRRALSVASVALVLVFGMTSAPASARALPGNGDDELLAAVKAQIDSFEPKSPADVLVIPAHGKQVVGLSVGRGKASLKGVSPAALPKPGSATAFIQGGRTMLVWFGNAAGWKRGTVVVETQLYTPLGTFGDIYVQKCTNSTYCNTLTQTLTCPIPGRWTNFVDARTVQYPTVKDSDHASIVIG